MDFVARAGTMLDRAHRLAGFLLILLMLETLVVVMTINRNAALTDQVRELSNLRPVYVVPGSQAGIYAPTQDDLLINAFVDHITQSLNSYTYENIDEQYVEVRNFFSPEMLALSGDAFEKQVKLVQTDRRSSLFISNRRTLEVEKKQENGLQVRMVTLRGTLQQILAGSTVETVPVMFTMKLIKESPSKTNPFGFKLAQYRMRELEGR